MLRGFNRFLLLFALFLAFGLHSTHAQPGTWAIDFGGTVQDYPEDVLVDNDCNTYVTGFFRDTIFVGTDSIISAGQSDIFLAKFDCSGDLIWKKRYGWAANEFARCLEFDMDGNVLLVGEYQDSTIIESDTLYSNDTLWYGPYSGTFDILILTVDTADGSLINWRADGWYGSENFNDIEVDSRNHKLIGGMFRTFTFFAGNTFGMGYDDAFMLTMDPGYNFTWKAVAQGKYIDKANAVAIVGDSLYVMGGTFQDTCWIRDSTVYEVTDFEDDIFVSCWDSSHQFRWHLTGHGPGKDHLEAVEADGNGNIYICGRFDTSLTIGSQTIHSTGNLDGFLAKISSNGTLLWMKPVGGEYFDAVTDLAISDNGKVLVTGYFQGEADFDGTVVSGADSLDQDVFVAAYDGNGSLIWVRRAGGSSLDKGISLDIDSQGIIAVTGVYSGTAWFGQQRLSSRGSEDIFVMRMLPDGSVSAQGMQESMLADMQVFPNPSTGEFTLAIEARRSDNVSINLMDMNGRLVKRFGASVGIHPGQNTIKLSATELPAGLYLLNIQGRDMKQALRVAVTH